MQNIAKQDPGGTRYVVEELRWTISKLLATTPYLRALYKASVSIIYLCTFSMYAESKTKA